MSALDRTRPPAPGAIRPFHFPDVDRHTLASGLDLRVARLPRLPVVSANLFVRAGEATLADERAGLAVLAGDALEGGTTRRSGNALAEALEGIGARISVSTGWEGTSVSLSCLADRFAEGLALLAEAVLDPAFPTSEVERARDRQLAGIRQRGRDPAALAEDHAVRRIFAAGDPYARPLVGSTESVGSFARDDVARHAEGCWRPGSGALVVTGDVDADEVEALARRAFEGWTGAPVLEPPSRVEPDSPERRVLVVDRPGSVQSELRVGHVGAARSDPDVVPLTVLNVVLGGTFTSRLNLNLRERHGFTYGVRSRFGFRGRPGPFQVSTAVGTATTGAALREIVRELDRLVDGGPGEEEVAGARDYVAGIFPLQLETAGQVAGHVSELVVYGLPDDYHATYRDRVRDVTVAAATEAGRRHVRPREAQVVVVADAEAVRAEIEALGLGPVEVTVPGGGGRRA